MVLTQRHDVDSPSITCTHVLDLGEYTRQNGVDASNVHSNSFHVYTLHGFCVDLIHHTVQNSSCTVNAIVNPCSCQRNA